MLKIYPAIFHEEDGSFWVEFPDLEGCQSCGATLEETMELAQEALGLYLATKIESKEEIPEPSDIKCFEASDGFVSYVTADPDKYRRKTKAVKKTLSIPEWLNEEAEKKHINFSSVLQSALLSEIEKR
ncbi:MAG: type II toxin-antitoxin system HicB family antitoxin [Eubacteriales bacterium]|nr:type II toxin-antitoxin system HicB family antitoxin [Eubacteriales bacterium]